MNNSSQRLNNAGWRVPDMPCGRWVFFNGLFDTLNLPRIFLSRILRGESARILMKTIVGLFAAICLFVPLPQIQAQTYTYPQLVERMTNMQGLAKLPPVGEKTSLASSYDRRSQYDAENDKYLNWDANGDGLGFIRPEGNSFVLAEIEGAGVISRIWSATPGAGHVKIYLDGSTTPAVDLSFTDYFSGNVAPFNRPNLVYTLRPQVPGYDNYTPISFAKSCKIVADKDWGNYYQFTYTQFPAGTVVPTFKMNLSPEDSAALDRADRILGNLAQGPAPEPKAKTIKVDVEAQVGKETTVLDLDGASAITALKVKLDLPKDPEAQRMLLSQLTVSITWDGDKEPSVWSPLGDFFGYVGGAIPYQSLPLGFLEDGTFYSYWYMPFGKKAHISVGNDGPNPVAMAWQVTQAPLTQPIAGLARFHAKWHRDAFLPTRADRQIDWTLLQTKGRGRYVGTHLHIWNPIGGWWGEGDDKFFIDGEKFPSSFGTGSEDYFGYAWSSPKLFSRPYHNQILNEDNAGHGDDNRWHIPDSVPFQTSFEGNIEKYYPNKWGTLYAAEAYWYLDAKGTDPYRSVPVADRAGYWVNPIQREPGVIEGEWMHILGTPVSGPNRRTMLDYGTGWSGARDLFWKGKPGEVLELTVPVAQAGKYHVVLRYTAAPDNGIVQTYLDGQPLGQPQDFYAAKIAPAAPIDLGLRDLSHGDHTLKIEITGKNPAAENTFFGLDYIKLIPLQ